MNAAERDRLLSLLVDVVGLTERPDLQLEASQMLIVVDRESATAVSERDAARYRHLVATCNVDYDPSEPWQLVIWEPGTGEDWRAKLDGAIDASMATPSQPLHSVDDKTHG